MMLSNIEIMWHDNIIVNECEAVDFWILVMKTIVPREDVPLCPPQISQDLTLDSTRPLRSNADI
jgi:hypothetical protein